MEYLESIENSRGDMLEMLRGLVAIRSVAEDGTYDMPFGPGVHDAFFYMLNRAKQDGFETENIENYGGHIEFGGLVTDDEGEIIGTSEEAVGILVHLDVVPEGKDWDFPPFGAEIHDGKLYGRGAMDDKGPAVASYFAMKALKDSGFMPEKKVRMILGLDEETGWRGMEKYLQKIKAPSIGFTPDAEFPVIHGEKGILIFELAKKMGKSSAKGLEIKSFKGGHAANMVADYARVVVQSKDISTVKNGVRNDRTAKYEKIKKMIAEYAEINEDIKIKGKGVGKSFEITVRGVSAHAAKPEEGVNAISVMMDFLGGISFANEDINEFIFFYNEHIGFRLDGAGLDCGFSDEVSGGLVFNVGMIDMNDEAVRLMLNIRYPVTFKEETVYDAMMPLLQKYDLGIVKLKNQPPIYFPKDTPLIRTLMDVYRKHTGDMASEAIIIGGGTYARAAENLVAFGAAFPGDEDAAHKKNESIEIDKLVLMSKIYADAIYELSKAE